MKNAACLRKDTNIFFPEKGDSVSGNEAITICFGCSVRQECREYKEATDSNYGIWAGEYSKRTTKSS